MRGRKAKMTPSGGIILDLSGMNKRIVQRIFRFIWIKGNLSSYKQKKYEPYCFYKRERSEDTANNVFK